MTIGTIIAIAGTYFTLLVFVQIAIQVAKDRVSPLLLMFLCFLCTIQLTVALLGWWRR